MPILNRLRQWEDKDEGDVKKVVFSLATGRVEASPIPQRVIDDIILEVDELLRKEGHRPDPRTGDETKWINIRRIQAALQSCGDPAHKVLNKTAKGAPLGWKSKLPRLSSLLPARAREA